MYSWTYIDNKNPQFCDTVTNVIHNSDLPHSLWQSPEWSEYLNQSGITFFITLTFNDELRGWALVSKARPMTGFSYSYLQRGPVGKSSEDIEQLLRITAQYSGDYLLVDPSYKTSLTLPGIRTKTVHRGQIPSDTLILDLTRDKNEIIKNMKKKGRYNLKKSFNNGLTLKRGEDLHLLEQFYSLIQKTNARQGIPILNKSDFQHKLEILNSKVFIVYKDDKPISGAITTIYGKTCYYYYGGMDANYSNLMSTYFLQWQLILYAIEQGCHIYDFLGISPIDADSSHYLYNVSRFKLMFGGRREIFAPPFLLINNHLKYRILSILKSIKTLIHYKQ